MTTVNEVNNDETKVPDEFVIVFHLVILLPNSMSKLVLLSPKVVTERPVPRQFDN